ncbi:hypothetical protein OPT61_g1215 [Boeremia exigua]|uniref:Uncharacterized protein n=1 Tax=Boeremia exigua TaxID=749465 RepID=A0ACC2IR97_9PLEO|nr:hypothetical protein OPT61_g1215 [Boeremia exigua]
MKQRLLSCDAAWAVMPDCVDEELDESEDRDDDGVRLRCPAVGGAKREIEAVVGRGRRRGGRRELCRLLLAGLLEVRQPAGLRAVGAALHLAVAGEAEVVGPLHLGSHGGGGGGVVVEGARALTGGWGGEGASAQKGRGVLYQVVSPQAGVIQESGLKRSAVETAAGGRPIRPWPCAAPATGEPHAPPQDAGVSEHGPTLQPRGYFSRSRRKLAHAPLFARHARSSNAAVGALRFARGPVGHHGAASTPSRRANDSLARGDFRVPAASSLRLATLHAWPCYAASNSAPAAPPGAGQSSRSSSLSLVRHHGQKA